MNPIILIAHGSRDPNWQKPFNRFIERFRKQHPERVITMCYMEIASPTLLDVCKQYQSMGYTNAILIPMFMASGGHVDHDIPKQVVNVQTELEGFTLALKPPIGEAPEVVDAMVNSIFSM